MRFFLRWFICCVSATAFSTSAAEPAAPSPSSPSVELAEPHAKITRIETPAAPVVSDTPYSGGIYNLLVDDQYLIAEKIRYHHYANFLTSQEGLEESSQIEVTYDPSFERLKFHFVRIRRGSEIINCWDDRQIKLLQRESEMDRLVFDGRVSAVLVLNGLRLGDTIDYAYSIEGTNPVYGDDFDISFNTQWSRPVEETFHRVVLPKKISAAYRTHINAGEPESKETDEEKEWIWHKKKIPALLVEEDVPYWLDTHPWVEVSSYRDWQQVNDWAEQLYRAPLEAALPADLESKLEEIRKVSSSPLAQAQAALQLIQDEVRYLGFEMGTGSQTPNPPALVWERRFGDCKDKTLLLSVLLRRLGLDAKPILVNTNYRGEISKWLPSPQAFDHVLIRLSYEGKIYWIDPTRSAQRGTLSEIYLPDYKEGLVIQEGTSTLSPIAWSAPSEPLIMVEETYRADDLTSPAHLEIKTRYRSFEADSTRVSYRSNSREKIEKNYLEYYAAMYPHIRRDGSVKMEDDPEKNEITITENYLIEEFWKLSDDQKKKTAEFDASMIRERVKNGIGSNRKMPLEIHYPVYIQQKTHIHLPRDWTVTAEKLALDNPAFEFFYEQKAQGKTIELETKFRTLSTNVPPEGIKEYGEKIEKVRDNLRFWISTPLASPVDAPTKPPESHLNWTNISFTLLLVIGCAYLTFRLVQWDKGNPLPPCPPELVQYEGLGGWLVLVGLGVLVRPLLFLTTLCTSFGWIYSTEAWENVTSPASSNYHSAWAPILLGELAGDLILIGTSVALIFLFFQRRRHFPEISIALMIFNVLFLWVDFAAVHLLPSIDTATLVQLATDAGKATLQAAVWVPYFWVSKRVRATFRN